MNCLNLYSLYIFIFMLQVNGMLHNTGQSLVFRIDKDSKTHVNISGGPLAYRYQFEEIYIHYGSKNDQGSEHYIHGYSFPAEVMYLICFFRIALPRIVEIKLALCIQRNLYTGNTQQISVWQIEKRGLQVQTILYKLYIWKQLFILILFLDGWFFTLLI